MYHIHNVLQRVSTTQYVFTEPSPTLSPNIGTLYIILIAGSVHTQTLQKPISIRGLNAPGKAENHAQNSP
jgi:hypothetical protein